LNSSSGIPAKTHPGPTTSERGKKTGTPPRLGNKGESKVPKKPNKLDQRRPLRKKKKDHFRTTIGISSIGEPRLPAKTSKKVYSTKKKKKNHRTVLPSHTTEKEKRTRKRGRKKEKGLRRRPARKFLVRIEPSPKKFQQKLQQPREDKGRKGKEDEYNHNSTKGKKSEKKKVASVGGIMKKKLETEIKGRPEKERTNWGTRNNAGKIFSKRKCGGKKRRRKNQGVPSIRNSRKGPVGKVHKESGNKDRVGVRLRKRK